MEHNEEIKIAVLEEQMKTMNLSMSEIKNDVKEMKISLSDGYVRLADFNPIKIEVDKLKYWQAKTIGMAAGSAAVIDLLLRFWK